MAQKPTDFSKQLQNAGKSTEKGQGQKQKDKSSDEDEMLETASQNAEALEYEGQAAVAAAE